MANIELNPEVPQGHLPKPDKGRADEQPRPLPDTGAPRARGSVETDDAPYEADPPPPGYGATGSLASGSGDPVVTPAGSEQQIRMYIISDKSASN